MVAEMASIRLASPKPFDFSKPDEWRCWIRRRRFEQFCFVSGQDDQTVRSSTALGKAL